MSPVTSFPVLNDYLSSVPVKTIHIVVPPLEKNAEPKTLSCTISNQTQLDNLLQKLSALLLVGNQIIENFEELVDGGFYTFGGPWYDMDSNVPALNNYLSLVPVKTIHIVVPPLEKNAEPTTEVHTLRDQGSLDKLLYKNRVSLFVGNLACDYFDDLVDGGIYTYGGPWLNADSNKRTSARVDATMVEIGSGLAVRNDVRRIMGTDTAHLHLNYKEMDVNERPIFEIDAIVHSADASSSNATAHVVECANAPQPGEVDILLAKVEKLKLAAASPSSHFHNCTLFVPVLAGRLWSAETTAKCKAHNPPIWRVKPMGALFEVRRT